VTPRPLYQLEAVTQSYGGRTVLDVGRLDVAEGERLFLVGPTGAGKSTLLRLLAGVEAPQSGVLRFAGAPLESPAAPLAVRRRITLVFQRPLLLSGSVRANVEYGLQLRRRRDPDRVDEVLDRLRLRGLASRPAQSLSGGEAQLVALARALVLSTDVLLLDEPTNGLDPARVARVEEAVAGEEERRDMTVVWATHNLFQARRLARRAALLLDGRLVEIGPAAEFFTAPEDPRTAAFVRGEMIY
jgi:tungstate transport system ATP-binding protein